MTHLLWKQRVRVYVEQLEQAAETIETILSEAKVSTVALNHSGVESGQQELLQSLGQLESLVAERETILLDVEAPPLGTTLIEKLQSIKTDHNETSIETLIERAKQVSKVVATAHERAISLFVCQFHLASYTTDVVRMLSGIDTPPTYRPSAAAGYNQQPKEQKGGGRLFNDAA